MVTHIGGQVVEDAHNSVAKAIPSGVSGISRGNDCGSCVSGSLHHNALLLLVSGLCSSVEGSHLRQECFDSGFSDVFLSIFDSEFSGLSSGLVVDFRGGSHLQFNGEGGRSSQ